MPRTKQPVNEETPEGAAPTLDPRLKHNRLVPIDRLPPHPDNYRSHPEGQIKNLMASLERFGQGRSVCVQDGPAGLLIVAGHGIYLAAQRLGYTELRADILPASWTPEQIKGYLVADNQHVAQAEDDQEILVRLLQEQQQAGYNLATLGLDDDSLNQMLADMGDDILHEGGLGEEEAEESEDAQKRLTLFDRFLIPPFSIFDARQGYWQDRKRAWIALGIKSELGRGEFALDTFEEEEGENENEYTSNTGGLTYGNSPGVTEKGLNYYRKREQIKKEGLLALSESARSHYGR